MATSGTAAMEWAEAAEAAAATPKVFLFINSGAGTDWVVSMAMAEDGHVLASHVSSNDSFAHHDIGHTSDWKHEHYGEHYPNGYAIEWVEDPRTHAGLMAAYAKNQAMAAAAKAVQP
jgi:hypothetical protein